jgi:tetratricopeptide (TPR) repeat protein
MRYVAKQFDSIRIKNLARLGILPMLHEWFATDPNISKDVAVQSMPDLWIGEDFIPIPDRTYFVGAKHDDILDLDKIIKEHQEFWAEVVPVVQNAEIHLDALKGLRNYIIRHMGLVANNLGVFLEDKGRDKQAFSAYTQARTIDPENISALLNQFAMIDHGFDSDQTEQIKTEIEDTIADMDQKLHVWSLARYYGYVRMPQAFAQMGMNWAMSGKPGLAVAGIKKAMELAPEENLTAMKQVLAGIYLSDNDRVTSEAIYKDLLKDNPKDTKALLGMLRVELSRNNTKEALVYLKKARKAGVDSNAVALEWASILAVHGDTAKARVVLNELLEKEKPPAKAWQLLVAILTQDKDQAEMQKCIEQMRIKLPENNVVTIMAEGNLALMKNEFETAREQFETVLAMTPKNQQVLILLLKLDVIQGRMDKAEKHAHQLLLLDADNSLANYLTGGIQLQKGELLLAEDSMKKALEGMRSPAILNDLAWVLQLLKKYDEAEKLAREAVEQNTEFAGAYDTLGVILTNLDRFPEAEEVLNKALVMMKGHPDPLFHLAELHEKMGDKNKLSRDIKRLDKLQEHLTDNQRNELEKLKRTDK